MTPLMLATQLVVHCILAIDGADWGPDYCTGIELAINSLTPQYERLQRAYENTVGTWQMDLVQWLVDIQQAWAFATSARVQLDRHRAGPT